MQYQTCFLFNLWCKGLSSGLKTEGWKPTRSDVQAIAYDKFNNIIIIIIT